MTKVKLPQVILPAGEHDAIVKDGTVFVAVLTGLPAVAVAETPADEEEKPAPRKPSRPVADDTKAEPKRRAAATKKAVEEPEEEPEEEADEEPAERQPAKPRRAAAAKKSDEPVEILPKDWPNLKPGTTVLARVLADDGSVLTDESNNDCEYFTVDIVKYDKRSKELTIEYHVDGDHQVLQDGDQLFEYNEELV